MLIFTLIQTIFLSNLMRFPNSWLRLITFCFITGLFLRHSAQNISHIGEQTRQNKLFPSSSSDKIPTIIDKAMEQKQNDRKRVPNSDLALRRYLQQNVKTVKVRENCFRKIYIPTETKFVSPLYDTEYLANSHSRAKRQLGFGGLGGLGGLGGFGGLGGGFGGCCPLMGPIPPMCCPMAMGIFAPVFISFNHFTAHFFLCIKKYFIQIAKLLSLFKKFHGIFCIFFDR